MPTAGEPGPTGQHPDEGSQRLRLGPEASMGDLVTHLAEESKRFVELQLELAKMQAVQTIAGGLYDALKVGLALGLFALAGFFLVIALALGLSVWVGSYWLGTLLTGVLLLIGGAIVLRVAVGTSFLLNVIPKDLLRQVRVLSRGPTE